MLLGCPAESLPLQHEFEGREQYAKALRVFLDKHYSSTYVEDTPEVAGKALAANTAHVIIGETVRTVPEHDAWHAVVGVGGKTWWDVHPSRGGLTDVKLFGLLVPTPAEWRSGWAGENCQCASCRVLKQH